MNQTRSKDTFYSGWAMEAYPDMDEHAMAHHITRQIENGANFIWIGHNNPGEVDAEKIEPGLSYAVWEALSNQKDPRHQDACRIVEAQKRLLDSLLQLNIPTVLPIGYQIQMGEVWNENNPDSLRRHPDGSIIDWGGVSACFYSPKYREDILRYYNWIAETFVEKYRSILLLVNLSDEPFGGDYSGYAEKAFQEQSGISFEKAWKNGPESLRQLGRFQSRYIVEYARWSAEAWHSVCPDIPSTMSFCGHHGREENTMPSVPGVFRDTPDYFQPTFDVYPRDGSQSTPVLESDLVMLTLLLRQLSYLSRKHERPYWLWTTGNSWGLGQASDDRANITDAVVNQIMAVSSAMENGGLLRGFAIWNYNIKCQGLYNDNIETIYDTEDMFHKLTRVIGRLRDFAGREARVAPRLAIVAERTFGEKYIAKSKSATWVKAFPFDKMIYPSKSNFSLLMDDGLSEILAFCQKADIPFPNYLIYLSSGEGEIEEKEKEALFKYLSGPHHALLPEKLWINLQGDSTVSADISLYDGEPNELASEKIAALFGQKSDSPGGLFHLTLDHLEIAYNLTKESRKLAFLSNNNGKKVSILNPFADMRGHLSEWRQSSEVLILDHHEVAFATEGNPGDLRGLVSALDPGTPKK